MITMRGQVVRIDRRGINPLDQHGVIDEERFRQDPSDDDRTPSGTIINFSNRSTQMYSMYEAFARERTREQLERAASQRLSSQLASARLWRRLAAYTARRAARSNRRLAEARDYQLVG